MLQLQMRLALHGETSAENGDFTWQMQIPLGLPLPRPGDFVELFDQIPLGPSDEGAPVAEVEFVGWPVHLTTVELLIHCDVENGFWYDRPWRQHLRHTGWQQLDDSGTPVQAAS